VKKFHFRLLWTKLCSTSGQIHLGVESKDTCTGKIKKGTDSKSVDNENRKKERKNTRQREIIKHGKSEKQKTNIMNIVRKIIKKEVV
jgi:hypothetical protein